MPKTAVLSADLEYALLSAIARGLVDMGVVEEAELSKIGRSMYRSLAALRSDGGQPPFDLGSLGLVAVDVLGIPRELVREYLRGMQAATAGVEVREILAKVKAKQVLMELINEAGSMLQKGILDVGLLSTVIMRDGSGSSDLRPLSESLVDGFPDPPSGIPLRTLPILSGATGGVYGMWAISGQPGVGKTCLAWQLALDVAQTLPVLYEDFENGLAVLMHRTKKIVNGDVERARNLTRNVYYRDSIRTLDTDLAIVKPPAVIFVDSVQKLPGSVEYRKASLDKWVHRLEYLKKRGYHIVVVSEVARSQYNQDAYIGAFKETGEIEYSADTGIQLLPGASGGAVEVHVVKSRHTATSGFVCGLERRTEWRFEELGGSIG